MPLFTLSCRWFHCHADGVSVAQVVSVSCRWCQCGAGGVNVMQVVSVSRRWCQCGAGDVSVTQLFESHESHEFKSQLSAVSFLTKIFQQTPGPHAFNSESSKLLNLEGWY